MASGHGHNIWLLATCAVGRLVEIRNDFQRVVPAVSRDPYAVSSRFGSVADAFRHPQRQGLLVPAFAGTTGGEIVRLSIEKARGCGLFTGSKIH